MNIYSCQQESARKFRVRWILLQLSRRHTRTCPHRAKGAGYQKCRCPIVASGTVDGERIRLALGTTLWGVAARKLAEIEQAAAEPESAPEKGFAEACEAFEAQLEGQESTVIKNRRRLRFLREYAESHRLGTVRDWTLEALDGYREHRRRDLGALAWAKELQFCRTLFGWCQKRGWCDGNPAKDMKMPAKPRPRPRTPYTSDEVASIIAAASRIGKGAYERLRARAMVLLMRFYGFRVGDVATLERARVTGDQIRIRAMKNGADLWAPLYPEVAEALAAVPEPQGWDGKPGECPWYFWSGRSRPRYQTTTVEATLQAVFRASGVPDAVAHRFRHTLATSMLAHGATVEDVAEMLGDDPATIREHYARWSPERQDRMARLLSAVHGRETAETDSAERARAKNLQHAIGTHTVQ